MQSYYVPSFSLLRDLRNQTSLEIDFYPSNSTSSFYGISWADEVRTLYHKKDRDNNFLSK